MSSGSPSTDLEAYDALPPVLRAEVGRSPWPVPCVPLAQVVARSGANAALRRLRQWERQFADDHALITAWACRR